MTTKNRRSDSTSVNRRRTSNRRGSLHGTILTIWNVVLLSLALDPLIVLYSKPQLSPPLALFAATVVGFATLPLLSQSSLQNILAQLRGMQKRSNKRASSSATVAIIGMVALVASAKLMLLPQLDITRALFIGVFIIFAIFKSASDLLRVMRNERILFVKNPLAQVVRWEEQLVIFCSIPFFMARAISFFGALSVDPNEISGPNFAPFFLCSFVLLALMKPQKAHFEGYCRRCKQPIPIVLVTMGSCPRCDDTLIATKSSSGQFDE